MGVHLFASRTSAPEFPERFSIVHRNVIPVDYTPEAGITFRHTYRQPVQRSGMPEKKHVAR